jgi:hypothetical protein
MYFLLTIIPQMGTSGTARISNRERTNLNEYTPKFKNNLLVLILLKVAASEGILQREVLSDHLEASQGDLEIKQSCESWQESRPTYKPCEPRQKSRRKRCYQR